MTGTAEQSTTKKVTIWSFPYVALILVNLFQSMAAFMANTTLPVYASELGASTFMVGIVVSAFSVTAILIRPFAGPAFDSFSRKWLLIFSQIVICACMFAYGVVDSLEGLIVIRLVHGIGLGCSGPLAMALVSEFIPESKFAMGVSVYTLAQSFAQVIGPAVGLYLAHAIGFSYSFFLSSACLLVAVFGVVPIKEPYKERLKYELKLSRMFAPQALITGLALGLLAISFSCMTSYVVLYGYAQGIQEMGFYFVVYALCLMVTRPIYGNLADKVGTPRMLIAGILFFASSYVALWAADSLPGFILAAVLGSAGFGCCGPLLQSRALSETPKELRGAATNTTYTGLDLGMLVGPIIGGVIVDGLTPVLGSLSSAYADMWIVMLIPAIGTFAIVIYWNIRREKK